MYRRREGAQTEEEEMHYAHASAPACAHRSLGAEVAHHSCMQCMHLDLGLFECSFHFSNKSHQHDQQLASCQNFSFRALRRQARAAMTADFQFPGPTAPIAIKTGKAQHLNRQGRPKPVGASHTGRPELLHFKF